MHSGLYLVANMGAIKKRSGRCFSSIEKHRPLRKGSRHLVPDASSLFIPRRGEVCAVAFCIPDKA